MKKYKIKLKHPEVEALRKYVGDVVEFMIDADVDDDNDRLLLAALIQVQMKLDAKLAAPQLKYRISFSPAESFAMRLMGSDFTAGNIYVQNLMLRITNEVHQTFQ